jgi:hypothetical protein
LRSEQGADVPVWKKERILPLRFLNNVIPEDQVLDKESLPKVRMPIGDEFGKGRFRESSSARPAPNGYRHARQP